MSNPSPLRGRTALITGSSGGLGRAIATELANHDCRLFLTGRDEKKLADTKKSLSNASDVLTFPANLASLGDIEYLIDVAREKLGSVDILVNCAGVFPTGPLEDVSPKEFGDCIAINVMAPFFLTRRLAPMMAQRGWGRIVNIGSSSAYQGFANTALYCASKHALLGLSRSVFQEYKGHGVRTYCLSPGSIQTEMGKKVANQAFETFIKPEDIARFLAQVIAFDGEMVSEEIRMNRIEIR